MSSRIFYRNIQDCRGCPNYKIRYYEVNQLDMKAPHCKGVNQDIPKENMKEEWSIPNFCPLPTKEEYDACNRSS